MQGMEKVKGKKKGKMQWNGKCKEQKCKEIRLLLLLTPPRKTQENWHYNNEYG